METPTLGALVPFIFRDNLPIRTAMGEDGEAWFVLADLCAVLDIGQPRTVTRRMDDDMVGTASVETAGMGPRSVTIVSEPGMYEIVIRSNRPEAKNLRRWVTHDVLPALRRTGHYNTAEFQRKIDRALMGLYSSQGAARRHAENLPASKTKLLLLQALDLQDRTHAELVAELSSKAVGDIDPDGDLIEIEAN